jgi:amidase
MPAAAPRLVPDRFDLLEASIGELAAAMHAGRISAAGLVDYYLARIAAFDKDGPRINAISCINPAAMHEARVLDDELRTHGPRGPLHGIPMVVKDNIDTVGMPTTAGCAALRQAYPRADAACVARLRAAGAIVLAKTNMSELAASNGRFGYSSANGLTLNPYRLSRNASGSSSGTGAAVAANFAAFGLGTDSFGSVRGPACVHALAGIRPTHDLVESAGVLPLATSFDIVGPLARNADDAAMVLDALVPGSGVIAQPASLAGRRLGIVTDFAGGSDEVDALFATATEAMRAAGAVTIPVRLPALALTLYADLLDAIVQAEWVRGLDAYLGQLPGGAPASTAALLAHITTTDLSTDAHQMNPLTLAALRHAFEMRDTLPQANVAAARRFGAMLDDILRGRGLEALVFPTLACPASPRFDMADATYHCRAQQPLAAMHMASASGFPEVSVPMGFTSADIPAGVSWLGRPRSDAVLLAIASAFERATGHRRPPVSTPALA